MAVHDYVVCASCSNRLGERLHGDLLKMRHKGRRVISYVAQIECESCGAIWTPSPGFNERVRRDLAQPLPCDPVLAAA